MDKECYSWRVHLLRKSGWKLLLLFPALLVAGLWGLYLGGIYLLLLAILVLVFALRDFLFPLTYQLTPEGVKIRGVLLREETSWDAVEEIEREKGLLRLKVAKGSSPRFSRWFVLHLAENEEEIWKSIERWRKN